MRLDLGRIGLLQPGFFRSLLRPAERREVVTHLVTVHGLPVQRACRAVGLGRATYYRPLLD